MEALFKAWKTSRRLFGNFFDHYSFEQLNKIPEGFNNNLIWNIGHIIVAQQVLIYKGANIPMYLSDEWITRYQAGTRPTGITTPTEIRELNRLLNALIDTTIADYRKGVFTSYNERTTGTGFHLASPRDAFECNNYHEGLHLGYMMSIKKFI